MRPLRVLFWPVILAGLPCSCDRAPPPRGATDGAHGTAVRPLLDRWQAVGRVEGILAELEVPTQLTLSAPPELERNGEFRVLGVPHLPLPSSLRVLMGDQALPRVETLWQARNQPSFLHAPARLRWQAEDSSTTGEKLRMLFTAQEPARIRLEPGDTLENRLEFVLGAPRLRVQARLEEEGAVPLRFSIKDEVVGTREVTSTQWGAVELPFARIQRPQKLTLQVPPEATGAVLVDWWEVETESPDLLLVSGTEQAPLTLEFRPVPPTEEQDLGTVLDGLGRAFGVFLGPEAALRFEGSLSSLRVADQAFGAEDLADGVVTLKVPAGLHEIHFEGTPGRMTLVQPAARLLPLAVDPSLRWRDFTVEALEGARVPPAVAERVRSRFDCGGDRRAAFWLPAPSAVELDLEAKAGEELRLAFGAHRPAGATLQGSLQFRVTWRQPGRPERILDETAWQATDNWLDRRIPVDPAWAGTGILRFECTGDGEAALCAAVANPRILGPAEEARPRPNVLVYLIDTLRADRLGCYQPGVNQTPNLDALAADGYRFEHFSAAASWTRPSTATVLTGLFPMTHGAISRDLPLPDSVVTLAESLRVAGLSTWAAVHNVQVHARGLRFEQGFDRFVTADAFRYEGEPTLSSKHINDTVVPWLEERGDEPFFLYLHSTDPHSPYTAPEPFDRGIAEYRGPLDPVPLSPRVEMPKDFTPGAEEQRYLLDLYDGAVRFQDAEFGRLMKELERLGLRQDTIVVVLSDHGEEFHEHGDWEHGGRSWEELLHVPFLLWVPPAWRGELLPPPASIPTRTSHADVLPSLLELAGADLLGPVQGESFVPSLRGETVERPMLVQERGNFGTVLQGPYKLLWRTHSEEETLQLFDLDRDPAESVDLSAQQGARVEGMLRLRDKLLEDLARTSFQGDAGSIQMTPEELEEMRRLGYVDDS